ncbi:MAG: lipoate--protein ligase family protein [Firmicutes bacterium]|nr:lipoate--protein ligase family protein [Bacillota bacterium]
MPEDSRICAADDGLAMGEEFLLYDLGRIPWWQTQVIYAALADLGRRALVFCEPDRPFYCLGYHDSVELLDLAYLTEQGIPVMRRDLGGGLVYLHPGQFFYQIVLPKTSPLFTLNRPKFYGQFLEPVAAALRGLGIPATYVPVADIWAGGRKISGNGAGEIGETVVLSGNVLTHFDTAGFLAGLKFDSPLQKQVVSSKVQTYVGWLSRLSSEYSEVCQALEEQLAGVLGPLCRTEVDPSLEKKMQELKPVYLDPSRLMEYGRSKRRRPASFKVAESVNVDYLPIQKAGLTWDVVGVRIKGKYTENYMEKGD